MNATKRSEYADYLAAATRYAIEETKTSWPEDTVFVVKSYSELAGLDNIIGWKILIMDMPSSFDFFVAYSSDNPNKHQKYFLEYLETFPIEFNE